MDALLTRHGSTPPTGAVIKQNDKGRSYFVRQNPCGRCGGAGGSEAWRHTGWTCFQCGGHGKGNSERVMLYTQDEVARLDRTQAKRRATLQAKVDAKVAAEKAEADARRAAFEAEFSDVLPWLRGAVAQAEAEDRPNEFLSSVLAKGERFAQWSEAQAAGVRKAMAARIEAEAKRQASKHVGEVGKRLKNIEVVVERVFVDWRPCFNAPWKEEEFCIATLRDADGNALVVKGTSFFPSKGQRLILSGTPKAHTDYKGEAQTILQRVKAEVVEALAEAA